MPFQSESFTNETILKYVEYNTDNRSSSDRYYNWAVCITLNLDLCTLFRLFLFFMMAILEKL